MHVLPPAREYQNPSNGRWYLARPVVDLFGETVIVLAWGGRGRAPSRTMTLRDVHDLNARMQAIERARQRRGYQVQA